LTPFIQGKSRMREIRSYGSVRGVAGDRYPYRDPSKKQCGARKGLLFFSRAQSAQSAQMRKLVAQPPQSGRTALRLLKTKHLHEIGFVPPKNKCGATEGVLLFFSMHKVHKFEARGRYVPPKNQCTPTAGNFCARPTKSDTFRHFFSFSPDPLPSRDPWSLLKLRHLTSTWVESRRNAVCEHRSEHRSYDSPKLLAFPICGLCHEAPIPPVHPTKRPVSYPVIPATPGVGLPPTGNLRLRGAPLLRPKLALLRQHLLCFQQKLALLRQEHTAKGPPGRYPRAAKWGAQLAHPASSFRQLVPIQNAALYTKLGSFLQKIPTAAQPPPPKTQIQPPVLSWIRVANRPTAASTPRE